MFSYQIALEGSFAPLAAAELQRHYTQTVDLHLLHTWATRHPKKYFIPLLCNLLRGLRARHRQSRRSRFKMLASLRRGGFCLSCFLVLSLALAHVQDLCQKYGDWMPIPGIDAQHFCETGGFTDESFEKCLLLDLAGKAFIQDLGNGIGMHACRAARQIPISTKTVDGQLIPFTLTEQRPVPATLPVSLMASEGSTYYFWWTAVWNFGLAASCAATNTPQTISLGPIQLNDPSKAWVLPEGWSVHSVVWSQASGESSAPVYIPLAAVIVKDGTLGVVIRGTETTNDWITDFTYFQAVFSGPISWPGQTHEGFSKLAAHLWASGIRAAVDELVLAANSNIKNVVVAGHSMGAGVGTLLAYTMQTYISSKKSPARVDALLFAPPNVGNTQFASMYGGVVNVRRLPFEADLVPQVPCSPTVTSCLLSRNTIPIPLGVWNYDPVPGTLMLSASGMPLQKEAWGNFHKLYPCQLGTFVYATHVCSYNCYLSQFVQGGSDNSMCLLWAAQGVEGQQQGTFCMGFPVAGVQYPYSA